MFADIDITTTVADELLPNPMIMLISQRDTAVEKLSDFEDEYGAILRDDYLDYAEAEDLKAASAALSAKRDPFKLPSQVDRARSLRPKVVATHRSLVAEARSADRAVAAAYRAAVPGLLPGARESLREAVSAAEDAYRAYLAARDTVGGATSLLLHLRGWANGDRPGYAESGNPALANGLAPNEREPVAELREVLHSFDNPDAPFVADPLVLVKFGNGQRMELRESQARALHGSSNNDVRLIEADA
jgi:hypothetical protein